MVDVEGGRTASTPFMNVKRLPGRSDGVLVCCSRWRGGNDGGLRHGTGVPPLVLRQVEASLHHVWPCLPFYTVGSVLVESCSGELDGTTGERSVRTVGRVGLCSDIVSLSPFGSERDRTLGYTTR